MTRRIVSPKASPPTKGASRNKSELPEARSLATAPTTREVPPMPSPSPRPASRTNEPREGETFGSEFLDNLAHQMIAPLQSIEMNCKNLLTGIVPEEKRKQRLGEVIGHARVLGELAQKLRFLHELISGAEVRGEHIPFKKVSTIWIDGFNNYLPQSTATRIFVDIDHEHMNPLPEIVASPIAVRQVVMNLYDNAFKYGREGGKIVVKATIKKPFIVNEFSHEARVPLTQAAEAHIFERGFRAPEARALRGSGTGVGMWVSKQLMLAMQGDIRAIPTNGGVTRFVLSWRLA
jgi:two-component system, OmpR family, phosphate regulon sensor histidine kinase PhoR